jgi:hypothetical protein
VLGKGSSFAVRALSVDCSILSKNDSCPYNSAAMPAPIARGVSQTKSHFGVYCHSQADVFPNRRPPGAAHMTGICLDQSVKHHK